MGALKRNAVVSSDGYVICAGVTTPLAAATPCEHIKLLSNRILDTDAAFNPRPEIDRVEVIAVSLMVTGIK